jgi:hypothetical protein
VQKEMIRLRDQLKGATAEQVIKVEELQTALIAEREAAKGLSETWDFMGNAAYDALDGILLKGESASDVLDNLVKSLAQAALQALILGEGPLASLFGTKGTSIVDLFVGTVATAPAAAAQKGLNIATSLPKAMAAQAGVQSQAANQGNAPGGAREIRVIIDGARGNREIEDAVRAGVSAGIKTYDREALPGRVRQVSTGGRRVG